MNDEKKSFELFVAHSNETTCKTLCEILRNLGHTVTGTSQTCNETIIECTLNPPDIIVSGLFFPDGDGIETLITISERKPVPAIIVTHRNNISEVEHAMDDHVMSYLVEPVTRDDLKPTIFVVKRRFDQMEELKAEVGDLKEALENRKLLDRAKGLLIKEKNLSEEDAYLEIRSLATKSSQKMGRIAQIIIETYGQSK